MRFGSITRVVPLVLALALAACGSSEQAPAPAPDAAAPAPAPDAGAPAPSAEPAAPAPAVPAGGSAYISTAPDAVANGGAVYASYCATCHGPGGKGDGPAAAGFNPPPADHSDGAYMNALSNEHLFRVVKEGGPAVGKSPLMAAWGSVLSDAQIREVVAFVRSLADPPYEPGA